MDLLTSLFLGHAVWMWLVFLGIVLVLLVLDLGVLNRHDHEIGVKESLRLSAFYITCGVAFAGFVWWQMGSNAAMLYLTGFVVEKSLAMDNIFVIAMIFAAFGIPRLYQHRVLFWGILGVIVLRALMIGFGAALVARYEWVLMLFAAFLVLTGGRMLYSIVQGDEGEDGPPGWILRMTGWMRVTRRLRGPKFFVRRPDPAVRGRMRLWATPLFAALVSIELADLVFAVDSVPAIFAITTDPFIVYTSNIFAILGLRALYFALAAVLHRFEGLKPALAILLIFIGGKVFAAELLHIEKIPPVISLGVTFVILGAGVVWSLWQTRDQTGDGANKA